VSRHSWMTKGGHSATFDVRDDTTDWNNIFAVVEADEYGLAEHPITGLAIDIGAHVGSVTIAMLLDNPGLHVVAVEALPENVEQIKINLALNRLTDRCRVMEAAASSGDDDVVVAMGGDESDFEKAHRFIGGMLFDGAGPSGVQVLAKPVSLTAITDVFGDASFMKIDCEGCEWSFLNDPAVARVAEIRGEYHPRQNNGAKRVRELLESTHVVTLDDSTDFGLFRAVHK